MQEMLITYKCKVIELINGEFSYQVLWFAIGEDSENMKIAGNGLS
jgi:hypothetical protein